MRSSSRSANFSLVFVDPRQQFGQVVRLGQVIIAAGAQSRDPVIDVAQGAQDQHRHFASRGAQRLDQRESVEFGQHSVDDRQIDGDRRCHVQTVETVRGNIDGVAHFTQRFG
jgi:hypothetical protein